MARRASLVAAASGALAVIAVLTAPRSASAYPEYQKWIQKNCERTVSCSMCHAHPDGPDGVKSGQIGSLDAEAHKRLDRARTSFEPGGRVDSPILNEFGNHIISTIGKKRFVALKDHPEMLPPLLDKSDLDGDGISDGQELRDGTHPLDPEHGSPWRLFKVNLVRYRFHLGMLAVATILGLYGIRHVLQWFAAGVRRALAEGARREPRTPEKT
jgi:hypothetical protein